MRGCPRCAVVSCQVCSNACVLPVGGRWRVSYLFFLRTSRKNRNIHTENNRTLVGVRHTSPAIVWAMYDKGESEPLKISPRSDFATLSLISSNEMCEEHEISPLQIQDLLENLPSRCCPRFAARTPFSWKEWKGPKRNVKKWADRQSYRIMLADVFEI